MAEKSRKAMNAGAGVNSEAEQRTRIRSRSGAKSAEKEKITEAAKRFKTIGEPTRLRIIVFLKGLWGAEQGVIAGSSGTNGDAETVKATVPHSGARISEICQKVTGTAKITSTFSHHIKELRRAGLIRIERDGKNHWCQIAPEVLDSLYPYLELPLKNRTPPIPAESVTGSEEIEGAAK